MKKRKSRLILQQLEERVLLDANPLLPMVPIADGELENIGAPVASAVEIVLQESESDQTTEVAEQPNDTVGEDAAEEEKSSGSEHAGELVGTVDEVESDSFIVVEVVENVTELDMSGNNVADDDASTGPNEQGGTTLLSESEGPLDNEQDQSGSQLVIVDSRIHSYEDLVDRLQNDSETELDFDIIVFDGEESGVDQIAAILADRQEVDALHIFSHGDSGRLYLGDDVIMNSTYESYEQKIEQWSNTLNDGADILLYGCNIAESEDGQQLVELLASSTGADVGASADISGNSTLGGDWDLEYRTGEISFDSLAAGTRLESWNGVLAPPVPSVTVDMPPVELIEEEVTFSVIFDNTALEGDPTNIGYGPYTEVYVPVSLNVTGVSSTPDELFTWNGTIWESGATVIDPTVDNHPLDGSTTAVLTVPTGQYVGDAWYIFKLPFGSYTPEQPPVSIDFTAELDEDAIQGQDGIVDSDLYELGDAVVGNAIEVVARGGFQYGLDAKNNSNSDPPIEGDLATGQVTPQLFTIEKNSDTAEGQTVTGPNYPVTYTVEVDIAPDQVIETLLVTDLLPANAVYRNDFSVTGLSVLGAPETPIAWQTNLSPDNDFVLNFGTVIGDSTDGTVEITLTYSVYYNDTALVPCGDPSVALNEADATGDYNFPDDGTDLLQPLAAVDVETGVEGTETQDTLNSITTEKFVTISNDTGEEGLTPGDTLTYQIYFEISDYFGFEDIVVTDYLGDGQHLLGAGLGEDPALINNPTLTVVENGVTTITEWDLTTVPAVVFDPSVSQDTVLRGQGTHLSIARPLTTGISTIAFDVSGLLADQPGDAFPDGELYGDLFAGDSGTGQGTWGLITFEAVVDEAYLHLYLSGVDASVDADDPISNETVISADTLSTSPAAGGGYLANGCSQEDNSVTEITVIGITPHKDLYHIEHLNPGASTGDYLAPGDVVTYSLTTTLSTGDIENFVIVDYLPLPVFDVSEFDTTFDNDITAIDPASIDLSIGGQIYWGVSTDLQNAPGIVDSPGEWPPVIMVDTASNSLSIDMGTFNSDANDGPYVVEILITATVQNEPFADNLNLTNQATWAYNNTFGAEIDAGDANQVELLAPELTITKGVIATDNTDGVFDTTPELLDGLEVEPPGSGADALIFSGTVTAADFLAAPMDSNLAGVDGGDFITYAVSVANVGGAGAHGLHIRDTRPEGFLDSSSTLNLQVWDGQGNLLEEGTHYNLGVDGFFDDGDAATDDDGIFFTANGVLDGDRLGERYDGTPGDDLFIITYTLQADNELTSTPEMVESGSTQVNTATIQYYTGSVADINDPEANWIDPSDAPSDDAMVTIAVPTIEKILVGSDLDEVGSGEGVNESTEAVVGERVFYSVSITVPEGETLNIVLQDELEQGLELASIDSILIYDQNGVPHPDTGLTDILVSELWGTDFAGFQSLLDELNPNISYDYQPNANSSFTLNLGNVENLNTVNDTDEVIVVSYSAMVVNVDNNVHDETRGNSATLSYDVPTETGQDTITTTPVSADDIITIIEPKLKVVKTTVGAGIASGPANLLDSPWPDWVYADSGDMIEYTIVISHDAQTGADLGATAYDVTFYDQLPDATYWAANSVNLIEAIHSGTGTDIKDTHISLNPATLEITTTDSFDLGYNETLTLRVEARLGYPLDAGLDILNYAEIDWTSYDGTPVGSGFVGDGSDSERTGDDVAPVDQNNFPVGVEVSPMGKNDYGDYDPSLISIVVRGEKYVVNTSISTEQDGGALGDLSAPVDSDGENEGLEAVIGEFITYRIDLTIPESEMYNAVVTDTLEPGLVLYSIDSITVTNEHPGSIFEIGDDSLINWDWVNNPYNDPDNPIFDGSDGAGPDGISDNITYADNAGTGDVLTIDLGNIKNLDLLHNEDEIVHITYTAMVTDLYPGNIGNGTDTTGTELNNFAEVTWEWADGTVDPGLELFGDLVEVIEPDLAVDKTVEVEGPGDAGDKITYTFTVEHTAESEANAYDLVFRDEFDDNLDPSSLVIESVMINGFALDGAAILSTFDLDTTNGILSTPSPYELDLPYGQTMVMVVSGTIAKAEDDSADPVPLVNPGDEINNSVSLTWTSIDNTAADGWDDGRDGYSKFTTPGGENQERGPHTAADVYTVTAEADVVLVPEPTIAKELVSTDLTDDANENSEATIGEIITYRVTLNLTEGLIREAIIVDTLGAGLEFVDVSLVSVVGGSNITTNHGDTTFTIGNITGTAVGQEVRIELGDLTVVGNNSGVDFDSLGGSQGDDRLVIEYRAVVTDIAANNALDGTAETFDNSVVFNYTNDAAAVETVSQEVPTDLVTLVEPELQVIKEVGRPGNILANPQILIDADAGDEIVYRLTINHTSLSGSGAYDISFTDDLPAEIDFSGVDFDSGTDVTVSGDLGLITSDFVIVGTTLQLVNNGTGVDIQKDQVLTIELRGTLVDSVEPNETITNTAVVEWTSLPSHMDNLPTNPPHENDGDPAYERGPGEPYHAEEIAEITIPALTIAKTGSGSYTIGDIVTFEIDVTLPEGITNSLVVTDNLPTGFVPIVGGSSVVTTGFDGPDADTAADPSPGLPGSSFGVTIEYNVGDGNDIVFTFDDPVQSGSNEGTDMNVLTLIVQARVEDINSNYEGMAAPLINSASLTYDGGSAGPVTAEVTVVEPEITTTKTVVDESGDITVDHLYEVLTYTVTFQNTGTTTAYDTTATDILALGTGYIDLVSVLYFDAGEDVNNDALGTDILASTVDDTITIPGQVSFSSVDPSAAPDYWDLAPGATIKLQYTSQVQSGWFSVGDHYNVVDADWHSQNIDSPDDRRTYDDTVTYPVDGVQDTDDAYFTVEPSEGEIGDLVWLDFNANGIQDGGEAGIPGVQVRASVEIINPDGSSAGFFEETVVTDSDGLYNFAQLPPAHYTIEVLTASLPVGLTPVYDRDGTLDHQTAYSLGQDEVFYQADFGYRGPEGNSIGDLVWWDVNKNGIKDVDELGLNGVTVTLEGDLDGYGIYDPVATTQTSEDPDTPGTDGWYEFDYLPYTNYRITVDSGTLPYGLTTPVSNRDGFIDHQTEVALTGPDPVSIDDADFGYVGQGEIGDLVWDDANADGAQDGTETGITDIDIRLDIDLDGDGVSDFTMTTPTMADTTATDGSLQNYLFRELPYADYDLTVVVSDPDMPANYMQSYDPDGPAGMDHMGSTTLSTGSMEDLSLDFGYTEMASVGDFVWFDVNGDGVQDAGEPGLVGVTVTLNGDVDLDGVAGDPDDVLTAVTDINGLYRFDDLPAGDYTIEIDRTALPGSDMLQTFDPDGALDDSTLYSHLAGTDNMDQDFGYTGEGSLGDYVWYDMNQDGMQDTDEPGINGVEVLLQGDIDNDGTYEFTFASTTTATNGGVDGWYEFTALPYVDYLVTVNSSTLPYGLTEETYDYDGGLDGVAEVSLSTTDTDNPDLDFGYTGSGSLGDYVWYDMNQDGVQDVGEPGINGVEIQLQADFDNDGIYELTFLPVTTTTSTGSVDGWYEFTDLPNLNYLVTVNNSTLPYGLSEETYDYQGVYDGVAEVSLSSGTLDNPDIDFGYVGTGTIGNYVWNDDGADGSQETFAGFDGVLVTLTGNVGGQVGDFTQTYTTTQLSALANYLFEGLPEGNYTVTIDLSGIPTGYIQSYDPDGSVGMDNMTSVMLSSGSMQDLSLDFGYTQTASVGDYVWYDINGDGVQDPGEPGLENVTVTLTGDVDLDGVSGDPDDVLTTVTDAGGLYQFDDLPAGSYTIEIDRTTLLSGDMVQTSDPDGTLDDSTLYTHLSGVDNMDQDFGYTGTGSIGDRIWNDLNRNGIQDTGEGGIGGVLITLKGDIDGDGAVDIKLTTHSDANGYYLFDDLAMGKYTLILDSSTIPSDLLATYDPDGFMDYTTTLALDAGENNRIQDFGFARPQDPVAPPPPPGRLPEGGDSGLMYQFAESAADLAILPFPEPEIQFLPPFVSVSPVYTGTADPGATVTLVLYDEFGGTISYQTVMADTAGNWLVNLVGVLIMDNPQRIEISQIPAIHDDTTMGASHLQTFFNPAFSSLSFSSARLDLQSITAYEPALVQDAIHEANNALIQLGQNNFERYVYPVLSVNPGQYNR